MEINLDDINAAKKTGFPYSVKIHPSYRCLAGNYLAKQSIRKGKDYRRTDADFENLVDTFLFRKESHALAFRFWIPQESTNKKSDIPYLAQIHGKYIKKLAASILGVQPMTGPTGQIFTMKRRYDSNP